MTDWKDDFAEQLKRKAAESQRKREESKSLEERADDFFQAVYGQMKKDADEINKKSGNRFIQLTPMNANAREFRVEAGALAEMTVKLDRASAFINAAPNMNFSRGEDTAQFNLQPTLIGAAAAHARLDTETVSFQIFQQLLKRLG